MKVATTMRRSGWATMLCAALPVLLVACGSGTSSDRSQAPTVESSGGVELVPPDPQGAEYPAVVGAGADILDVGGFARIDGENVAPVATVSAYSTIDREWRSLEPAPFDPPLFNPGTVWTGRELVVAGNPCEKTTLADEPLPCEQAIVEAGVLSVATNTWRTLEVPTEVYASTSNARFLAQGLGWTGEEAIFGLGQLYQESGGIWLVNPESGAWRKAPSSNEVGWETCLQQGALYQATSVVPTAPGGPVDPGVGTKTPTLGVRKLDLSQPEPRWVEVSTTPKPSLDFQQDNVLCLGTLVYLQDVDGTLGQQLLAYDAPSDRWQSLPGLDLPFELPLGATSVGTRLLWPSEGSRFMLLPSEASEWQSREKPASLTAAAPAKAGPLDAGFFVAFHGEDGSFPLAFVPSTS
jgi:hypothetical protein